MKLQYLYGRQMGRNYLFHQYLLSLIPTLKKGYKIGVPVEGGIGVFEFKGVMKPKSELTICGIDESNPPSHKGEERREMSKRDIFNIMMLSLIYICGVITGLLAQIRK